jgi:hypothetical protein
VEEPASASAAVAAYKTLCFLPEGNCGTTSLSAGLGGVLLRLEERLLLLSLLLPPLLRALLAMSLMFLSIPLSLSLPLSLPLSLSLSEPLLLFLSSEEESLLCALVVE